MEIRLLPFFFSNEHLKMLPLVKEMGVYRHNGTFTLVFNPLVHISLQSLLDTSLCFFFTCKVATYSYSINLDTI